MLVRCRKTNAPAEKPVVAEDAIGVCERNNGVLSVVRHRFRKRIIVERNLDNPVRFMHEPEGKTGGHATEVAFLKPLDEGDLGFELVLE